MCQNVYGAEKVTFAKGTAPSVAACKEPIALETGIASFFSSSLLFSGEKLGN